MFRLRVVLVALLLMLGACNRVTTDQPLFFPSDAPDAPRFREGVWLLDTTSGEDAKPCRVDTRRPVNRWPRCAQWVFVRGGEMLGVDDKGPKGEWQRMAYVLAAGQPPVLQYADETDGQAAFQYYGVTVTRQAADGRIEAFGLRPVLCGPPPPDGATKPDGSVRYATLEPLPGMTVQGDNCTTDSPDAVRAAALASQAWTPLIATARWVRDTYP